MDNLAEPCDCLKCANRCEFFNRLTPIELEKLNSEKKALRYNKGELIIKGGGYSPYTILISSGYIKVMVEEDHEKCFILELLGPRNIITGNLFEDRNTHFTMAAITEVVICNIESKTFIQLMESNGRFATDLMRYSNEHGAIRFQRLHSITLKHSRGKLADVLLYLHKLNQNHEIFKSLSRQELADMANISMENAIRTLKEFVEEGLITIDKKDIQVINMEGLKKVSQKG